MKTLVGHMTIHYRNNKQIEGAILARTEDTMRVAVSGCEDTVILREVNGKWVTEDCEPVRISLGAPQQNGPVEFSNEEFICSHELAAHLKTLLRLGGRESIRRAMPRPHIERVASYV